MGRMGLRGRIRRWVGRHWCRDLAELREQVQRAVNDRDLLAAQGRQIENLLATIRELTEHNVRSLGEMAAAHKKLLAEDLSKDLARIITTYGLVGCRLEALRERMGIGVLSKEDRMTATEVKANQQRFEDSVREQASGRKTPVVQALEDVLKTARDTVSICTGDGVRMTFQPVEGFRCCKIVVTRPRGGPRTFEVPIWPAMTHALHRFLAEVDEPEVTIWGRTEPPRDRERIKAPPG